MGRCASSIFFVVVVVVIYLHKCAEVDEYGWKCLEFVFKYK